MGNMNANANIKATTTTTRNNARHEQTAWWQALASIVANHARPGRVVGMPTRRVMQYYFGDLAPSRKVQAKFRSVAGKVNGTAAVGGAK